MTFQAKLSIDPYLQQIKKTLFGCFPKGSHTPKKLLSFGHYPKFGRGGPTRIQKFWVVFLALEWMVLLFPGAGAEAKSEIIISTLSKNLREGVKKKKLNL